MSSKFFLYLAMTPLVIFGMSSLNINGIFKKNHIVSARVLYFLLGISLIYLSTEFIYDVFLCSH